MYRERLEGRVKGCIWNHLPPKLEDKGLVWGYVRVYKNNERQMEYIGWETGVSVDDLSAIAAANEGDWTIMYSQPLSEATYQWQGDGWYLVEIGEGFA